MSIGRLVAGIGVAAALMFAVLWWSSRPAPPAPGPAVPQAAAPAAPPNAALAEAPPAVAVPAPGRPAVEPLVPLAAGLRAQFAMDFARLRLAPAVRDRLVAADVRGAAALLRDADDDASTLALDRLGELCLARLGDTTLRAADAAQWMPSPPDPATAARLDAYVDAQRAWSAQFRSGCEAAGLLRGGSLRAETEQRVLQCSARGNPHCRALAAERESGERRTGLLRGAAVLGSVDAQALLLAHLEVDDHPDARTPEQRRAREQEARVWRESLAKGDPEWRASLLGCFERDCDPSRIEPAAARRTLESAAREGSFSALLALGTSERVATDLAAIDPRGAPERIPFVNPSEPDAYAWKAVSERLALQGCFGLWPTWAAFVGTSASAERELRPSQLDEARALTERYWQEYGAGLAAARGCEAR